MVNINPEIGVAGQTGSLADVLAETKGTEGEGEEAGKINVVTDEIEEKTTAIDMLSVFIEQTGMAFTPYIDGTTQILLPMLDYSANTDIRESVVGALALLVKAAKYKDQNYVLGMSKTFILEIFKTSKKEQSTEVLQA